MATVTIATINANSLRIDCSLKQKTIRTKALIDSGATDDFMDTKFAIRHRLPLQKLPTPITCKNVDGTTNKNGKITHCTYQRTDAGGQNRFTKFLLPGLDGEDVLLGFSWL
ncbi:hypothetical protein SERLA73DRAFT_53790 [Serpula lacrymans var. lacrymans S7.3]|uniref:Peptidase A2 domain-containing protein n=1 Tax=Serpula lacrymans var. lacrymans (strain S7.3) TaxID=936435 RepID=F8PX58_SERL3|nr:hypothetical protein SERLA73DRAFT_53790 [Serpula lacrymans var. lacrymans S7.3]